VEDRGHGPSTYNVLPHSQRTNENFEYLPSNSQSPSQDSNWIPLEYMSEVLPLVSLLGERSY
jgi:hypothetical protein